MRSYRPSEDFVFFSVSFPFPPSLFLLFSQVLYLSFFKIGFFEEVGESRRKIFKHEGKKTMVKDGGRNW